MRLENNTIVLINEDLSNPEFSGHDKVSKTVSYIYDYVDHAAVKQEMQTKMHLIG